MKSVYLTYSEYLIDRIEKDRQAYYRLGPSGGDDTAQDKALRHKYVLMLRDCQSKSDIDSHKTWYRHVAKMSAMTQARAELAQHIGNYQKQPIFTDMSMTPWLQQKFSDSYGRISLSDFILMVSIWNAHAHMTVHWKGFSCVSHHSVQLFTGGFNRSQWKRVIAYLMEREWIELSGNQDMHKLVFRKMAGFSKSPQLRKMMKDEFYLITRDGIAVQAAVFRWHAEFVQHMYGCLEAVTSTNLDEGFKQEIGDYKRFVKKSGSTTRKQKSSKSNDIRRIHQRRD